MRAYKKDRNIRQGMPFYPSITLPKFVHAFQILNLATEGTAPPLTGVARPLYMCVF